MSLVPTRDSGTLCHEEIKQTVVLNVGGLAGSICQKSVCRELSVKSLKELLGRQLGADCRELKLFLNVSELNNDELLSHHLGLDETSAAITLVREFPRELEVERQALAIIGKRNWDPLQVENAARQLSEMPLTNSDDANYMVKALLEQALYKSIAQDMYVNLIVALQRHFVRTVPDAQSGAERSFRAVLLNGCQSLWETQCFVTPQLPDPAEVSRHEQRRARCVSLFGAMFLKKLFAVKILGSILTDLVGTAEGILPVPRDVESTALLVAQTGPDLEQRRDGEQLLRGVLQRLEALAAEKRDGSLVYGHKIRFLVQDLLDLRARQWTKSGRLSVLEHCR